MLIMQSKVISLLIPEGSLRAAMLVRRGNGQIALQSIDARVAAASRVVAGLFSPDVCFPPSVNPGAAS
jgi:hypothetical protein